MTALKGRWSLGSVAVAVAIVAVALVLHHFSPGNAEWRADYETVGDGGVDAATITVQDAELTAAPKASFDGTECSEDGIFLLLRASYVFAESGNFPDRGMIADGVRYLPAACQDDTAGPPVVPGQQAQVDTVFVVGAETWEEIRGTQVSFQVAQLDPWYQNFGTRAVITMTVPVQLDDAITAQVPR